MAAEYSYPLVQTVAADANLLFLNGSRACRKGYIQHNDNSGVFLLKGTSGACKAVYKVQFDANVAIAEGGTVEPIAVALKINGEQTLNTISIVTPAAIGDYFNVSFATFIEIPCSCCFTVSVQNVSATTAIDVQNANIIFDRIA